MPWSFNDSDSITPTRIEHNVDEIWVDGRLEQCYNFIDYHFESSVNYFRARAYADDMENVTLFGPFERRESLQNTDLVDHEAEILSYLGRRFVTIRRR